MKRARCLPWSYLISSVFFTIFFFVLLPQSIFAAFSITNLSTTTINSPDDVVTVSASASGLQNSTQYLQVLLTKEGTTNYFGFSKNNKDEWYQYKSSPSVGDLSSYFYNFTPSGGTWMGDIQAKVDINDSSYKGPGLYTVKLAKYISGSPSYATNTMNVTINIAFTPTPVPTSIPTDMPTPTKVPTPTKTPTPIPTAKASNTPSPSLESKIITVTGKPSPTKVLGVSTKSAMLLLSTVTPTKKPKSTVAVAGMETKQDFIPFVFIAGGILLLISCGILTFQPQLKKLWEKK